MHSTTTITRYILLMQLLLFFCRNNIIQFSEGLNIVTSYCYSISRMHYRTKSCNRLLSSKVTFTSLWNIQTIISSRVFFSSTIFTDEDQTDTITNTTFKNNNLEELEEGIPNGFYIHKKHIFNVPNDFNFNSIDIDENQIQRLSLTPNNVTLPIALMIIDKDTYPSLSRARKSCRKGNILIEKNNNANEKLIGRVKDRICTNDIICYQTRMGNGCNFPVMGHKRPPFHLPVIYEDDHIAIVNKPAGIVTYRQGSGVNGLMSVRAMLPFVLQPSKIGTYSILRRPASVHRIDKPTSGILCIVKTKPAMINMTKQFHDRIVKKTYMAIINGIPEECSELSITSKDAAKIYGVDVDVNDKDTRWQIIDSKLDDKHAVTIWRAVRYVKSLHANDGYLTLVELKPKTGRYHQLRRHMAWVCKRPLIGDSIYDDGTSNAMKFRNRGLFLCANRITFEHPYYNTEQGRKEWEEQMQADEELLSKNNNNGILWINKENNNDKIMVTAQINLPDKFDSLLTHEEERYMRLK